MMILVVGGAGSGKSEYAENLIGYLAEGGRKYYIATMKCSDDESLRRVEKHRLMRKDKGFITIEQPVDIDKAGESGGGGELLLECVSNLAANEMFSDGGIISKEQIAEKIVSGIDKINNEASVLVVVTNNIFEDGICYDTATEEYIKALGMINRQLAEMADQVVEVVCGIPVILK